MVYIGKDITLVYLYRAVDNILHSIVRKAIRMLYY